MTAINEEVSDDGDLKHSSDNADKEVESVEPDLRHNC